MIGILLNFVSLLFGSTIVLTIGKKIKFHLQYMHNNASLNVQLLQKEILETFSKSLPSSNNLETLAEQLANQLSGLNPRRWFQNITHSIGSETIMLIIILVIIFVVYRCLSTKIVQTKQTQLVRAFFTKSIYSHPQLWKNKKEGILRGCSTSRDPICCIFFHCVPFLKTLCSLSVPGKQEQAELHAVLRTEIIGKSTCFDSLQWPFTYRSIHFLATDGISFLMAE